VFNITEARFAIVREDFLDAAPVALLNQFIKVLKTPP
jgi:hypothetical protein